MNLGSKIREQRRRMNFTQSEFANMLGVHENTIRKWEKGQSYPNVKDVENIAKVLGITTELLYDDTTSAERITNKRFTPKLNTPNMAYWGEVADNIRKLANINDKNEILVVYAILKYECDKLAKALPNNELYKTSYLDIQQNNVGHDATINLTKTSTPEEFK